MQEEASPRGAEIDKTKKVKEIVRSLVGSITKEGEVAEDVDLRRGM